MSTNSLSFRYQLNSKKNKVDECPVRKPNAYPTQQLLVHLSGDSNNETIIDETFKLSKSLIQGSVNICKRRVLTFTQTERVLQGLLILKC